jgi:hypothetical protein
MKTLLVPLLAGVLGVSIAAFGQTADSGSGQAPGRGRGGAPHAWNDKDKDGICDLTGKPVGQGRGAGFARGGRRGPCGRGMARGRGFAARQRQNPPPQPQASPAPEQK